MITINLPQILRVSDYHELKEIRNTINNLKPNIKVKVSEIGFDGQYVGILYTGNLKDYKDLLEAQYKICDDWSKNIDKV